MKYTPYPNYVRLTQPKLMKIYNQDEVTARDEKRAEDARKQEAREKRKGMPQKDYGANKNRGGFGAGNTYHKFDKNNENKTKKFGNVVISTGNYKKRDDKNGEFGDRKKFTGERTFTERKYGDRPFNRNRNFNREGSERDGENRPYRGARVGEGKAFSTRKFSDRKYDDRNGQNRRSYEHNSHENYAHEQHSHSFREPKPFNNAR